ncbi:hypothetical protein VO64_4886 [Pseudomonas synxantha]|uniref:Uncharacterized protein n=1 Tax=Pseudomonas synxantha TaxID=47883 RepID=A0AAU8U4B4_9PSED|nr:hypothetical protein VO64_4886 [Pseudomonas synxantha]
MQDAQNLYYSVSKTIGGDERKSGQDQFSDIWNLGGPAQTCKCFQLLKRLNDLSHDPFGGFCPQA